jgi:signal transduction histidine kinase
MKIRDRLTLQFILLVAIILGIVLVSVYYLTAANLKTVFYDQLKDRTEATSNYFLEEDEVEPSVFVNFKREYARTLPGEIIQLFDSTDHVSFVASSSKIHYSAALLDLIRKKKELKFSDGDRLAYGIYYLDNQGKFDIIVSAIDVRGEKELQDLRLIMILGFAISLLLMFFAGRIFSNNALAPIQEIIESVNKISSSQLHLRVNEGKGKDEIARVAITFNNMLDRLEASFSILETFVDNASHELRTPLTTIIGEIDVLLSRERANEEYKTSLQSLLTEAQQMKEMVGGLLNLVRAGGSGTQLKLEEVRLDELLNDVKSKQLSENPDAIINLSLIDPPDDPAVLEVTANRQLLYIGIFNIIDNAVKFSDHKPVNCILQFENEQLVLKIIDLGIGIAADESKKVFQPFYRSSNAHTFPGHGIGLALSEKIFHFFGASLSFESELEKGTCFVISFPKREIVH